MRGHKMDMELDNKNKNMFNGFKNRLCSSTEDEDFETDARETN